MGKIFYAETSAYSTNVALKKILLTHYNVDGEILRSKNGKPYVKNGPLFSVSHTEKGFVGYNTFRSSNGPDYYGESLDGFLKEKGYFGAVLIGIKKKENSLS